MKKLRNLFLAVLVLIVSVFTANTLAEEKGSITITNATKDRTYEIYKIFDLTYSGTNVAYTIDEDWVAFFNGDGSAYIVNENNTAGTLNQITIGSTTKYINITQDNKIEFANAALEYARGQVTLNTQVIRKTATANDALEFANLDLGYYLVYPVGATIKTGDDLTVASIDSTLKDLRITLKATYPTLTKDFHKDNNTSSYDVGSVVKFELKGQVPDTTGFTSYTYTIHDEWSDGLAYDENNFAFKVKVGETTLSANQYTLTVDATNRKFDLELGAYVYEAGKPGENSIAGQAITVTYGLVITEDAIAAGPDYNQAKLEYSNNPKNTETSTTDFDPEYVYSSKVVVTKVDGNNETTTLAGAKFVLKNREGKYYYYDEDNDMVLWVSGLEATETEPAATVLTTPANGVVEFIGLKDGTYFLVETEAPLGFNKLPEPVKVSIDGNVNANNIPVAAITNETVKNYSGAQLPSTGGFGTKLFVIIGSLLAMISGVVLVTNKRMAKEEI